MTRLTSNLQLDKAIYGNIWPAKWLSHFFLIYLNLLNGGIDKDRNHTRQGAHKY